jgi:hypothetical protein
MLTGKRTRPPDYERLIFLQAHTNVQMKDGIGFGAWPSFNWINTSDAAQILKPIHTAKRQQNVCEYLAKSKEIK